MIRFTIALAISLLVAGILAIGCGNPTDLAPVPAPKIATFSIDSSQPGHPQISCADPDDWSSPIGATNTNGYPVVMTCFWRCAIWPYGPQPAQWYPEQQHRILYTFVRLEDGTINAEEDIRDSCNP
jgi:hypothetical protein